ncbi:two-component system sensor histidine kinase NtrB [Sutcliffiella rhizosphaerae]|uniref:histidine kinase n=1 Tax=Sutcliffiella rhizosphaerae TaxID=2880967 RepID=A0ABM8YHI6_9BACI|nr:ATP-binding protein [Sutcliffiella rhizosphaerae]CAG9619331.1 Adaptive-response sensory-kinase SasA [Sutcliffiella rhizosphaerae]
MSFIIDKKEQNIFQKLSSDLRIILNANGFIEEWNEQASKFLDSIGEERSFFLSFPSSNRNEVYTYLQQIIKADGKSLKRFLFHRLNGTYYEVAYSGLYSDGRIYLSGHIIEGKDSSVVLPLHYGTIEQSLKVNEFMTNLLDIAILVLSKGGNIEYINNRCMTLLELDVDESYNNLAFQDLLTPVFLKEKLYEIYEEVLANKTFKERICYDDDMLFQIQGIHFERSQKVFFIIHDRSYQQRFENLLIYKQQMESVSQISAGMAHELRNPLSVIKGFIQLSQITNNWNKYYDTIMAEINRMNAIIEDFLAVSRKKVKKQSVQPQAIFQSLVYIFQSECLLHNIDFDFEIDEVEENVIVNEAMIKQVMLNFLRNAIEAYPADQKNKLFLLRAKRIDSFYEIKVIDNGRGMNAEVLDRIGKPFFTTKEKGNGLGIPLCKKIIEDHDGELFIDSKLGEGSTFCFRLPLVK